MRNFITFALAALMASSAVTVHGLPLLGDVTDSLATTQPLDLDVNQLTECVTQILDGAETCDLSLLDGLVPTLLKTVGDLLSLDGHVLDLDTLTDLVHQAVASLIKDGKVKEDGSDIQVTEVVVIVRGLLVHLPATDAVSDVAKRDLLSDVTSILGNSGLTLADLKVKVQSILTELNVPDVDLTHLPLHAEKAVCSLIEGLNLNCKDVLTLLDKQQ